MAAKAAIGLKGLTAVWLVTTCTHKRATELIIACKINYILLIFSRLWPNNCQKIIFGFNHYTCVFYSISLL